jgi:hypothetical protein
VLVREEAAPYALQGGDLLGAGPFAERVQHRGGDLHGDDPPEAARGRHGELARARAEIDDGRVPGEAIGLQQREVLAGVGVPLLAVETRDEGGVEVFGAGVDEFVGHPVGGVHGTGGWHG